MRRRQEEEAPQGSPAWMATYGDMVTLLLTFFILLFSMSTIDIAKYKSFISAFDGGAGVLDGEVAIDNQILLGNGMEQHPELDKSIINSSNNNLKEQQKSKKLREMTRDIEEYLGTHNLEQKVEVKNNGDYISLTFDDILLFDTGKANLKPGAIPVLDKVGVKLREYLEAPGYRLRFEGHTDNLPINTVQFPSNWELSAARAIAVAKFYIEEMNFNPEQISTEGFGQHVPVESNDTAEGRAINRRVEIKIVTEPGR